LIRMINSQPSAAAVTCELAHRPGRLQFIARTAAGALARLSVLHFALAVLASRILLLAVLRIATGGQELSNDTAMHMGMIRHPMSVLLSTGYSQNPPLLPFIETLLGYPLQLFLSDFLTLRLVMIAYETVLAVLFYRLLNALALSEARRGFCFGAFLLLPMGWMTSVVMAQDEVIAAAAFLVPLLLFVSGRQRAALFACGVGVVAAKLFIGLELLTLAALGGRRRLLQYLLLGLAPIGITYGAMTLHCLLHGLPPPLLGFRPDPTYGTNFWILLRVYAGIDLRAVGPYSGLLALAASLAPAAMLLRSRRARDLGLDDRPILISVAANTSLLIFFSLFYHINAEYYVMTMPLLLAASRDATDVLTSALVSVVPWAGKLFQNAQFLAHADVNSGKMLALKYYALIFRSSPEYWLMACQIVFSILTVFISVKCCLGLARLAERRAPLGS
jgi:hypothetical protein